MDSAAAPPVNAGYSSGGYSSGGLVSGYRSAGMVNGGSGVFPILALFVSLETHSCVSNPIDTAGAQLPRLRVPTSLQQILGVLHVYSPTTP